MKHIVSNQFEFREGVLISGTPSAQHTSGLDYDRVLKRALDIVLSLVGIVFVVPVVALLAALVARDGGSPFFGHMRVGRDGKPFKCWKLRSMVIDAQERLDKLLASDPEAAAQWKEQRKLDDDPRITRFGQFLRRSSLDELPQLLNILKGEMSFVGPRPVPRSELDENYGHNKVVYERMRPGLTGQWQVSGRNDVSYAERVQMDIDYFHSMSVWNDLKIIAQTVLAVLNRTGK